VAVRFVVKEGKPQVTDVVVSSPIGALEPAFPSRNAQGRPEVQVAAEGEMLTLVQVPAGRFRMGTNATDLPWFKTARPVHEVTISRDFWMGKFPVTQGQWAEVMGTNPSFFFLKVGVEAPVENVSWDDAQAFLARLNYLQHDWTFRLPTEAEWEYACRAGSEGETYGPVDEIAWCKSNSAGTTHPVGQKRPNAFGLYDMSGNVDQWCQDWFQETYYQGSPAVDPQGPASGHHRVRRGGSWNDDAANVRSAYRNACWPDHNTYGLGLRVVAVARKP
jgi:formylglycine-generating enzyme required for sulfatase activity